SALVSSVAAVPFVCWVVRGDTAALALYATWLAAVWLVLAWARRWPVLYVGVQAALTGAVLLAVTAWLEGQPWRPGDPRGVQAYGLGIAGLGLLSVAVRWLLAPAGGTGAPHQPDAPARGLAFPSLALRAGVAGPRFEELAGSAGPAVYRL